MKHAFNKSDEGVVERWAETPTWQYLSGLEYFEHRWPCNPTAIGKFRRLLGEEGVEELLAQTINVAVTLKLIARKDLAQVIVDSTVQQKAVAYPTDSKLLETARAKLVEAAKQAGIELKQTYAKESQGLRYKAGRYAHASQFKRMRRVPLPQLAASAGAIHPSSGPLSFRLAVSVASLPVLTGGCEEVKRRGRDAARRSPRATGCRRRDRWWRCDC